LEGASARHCGDGRSGSLAGAVAACNSMAAGKSAIQSSWPSQFIACDGHVKKITQIAAIGAGLFLENGGIAKF
jgi:hypothetical protein